MKTSRIGVNDAQAARLTRVLRELGLGMCVSGKRYLGRRDIGKGGWSNSFASPGSATESKGDWLLYVANSRRAARLARDHEEAGRENDFGADLGIPECCRVFYLAQQAQAMKKQNDYVPLVLDNTDGPPPYNRWNNYVAQYFGYSLLSFFPCSFNCASAASTARSTYEFLRMVCPSFAKRFVYMQRWSILYTEYRGLHLFERSSYREGRLTYDSSRIHTTLPNGALMRHLLAGTELAVQSKHAIDIRSATGAVKSYRGSNVCACIF
jgi:hypothetical protein